MKNIYSKSIGFLLILVIYSCKEKDSTPSIPILKSYSRIGFNDVNSSYKTINIATFEYSNSELSKVIKIDSSFDNSNSLSNTKKSIHLLTSKDNKYNLQGSEVIKNINESSNTSVLNLSAELKNNIYEVTKIISPSETFIYLLEIDDKNLLTKLTLVKNVFLDLNGKKTEQLNGYSERYEYDSNRNIRKIFSTFAGFPEKLVIEFTYDSNPNPFINLKWIGRLTGVDTNYENANNILTVKWFNNDVLINEKQNIYNYNNESKYPISVSTIETFYSYGSISYKVNSKTIFNYQ
jgi:hypothetical protein